MFTSGSSAFSAMIYVIFGVDCISVITDVPSRSMGRSDSVPFTTFTTFPTFNTFTTLLHLLLQLASYLKVVDSAGGQAVWAA